MSTHDELFQRTIADTQRYHNKSDPEAVMIRIQMFHHGVLSGVVEHGGDLMWRMTEKGSWTNYGRGAVYDKARRVLDWLTYPYGFVREHNENIVSNARGKDEKAYRRKLDRLLTLYSRAHAKLPVYNAAQFVARQIAVLIGRQEWKKVQGWLKLIMRMADSPDWERVAGSVDPRYVGRKAP